MSRSVEEILENIDTATSDELMLVANASSIGDEAGAVQDEKPVEPAASGDAANEAKDEQKTEETAPIQTRDGKHTIPYEVLANTRAAKEAAEAQAKVEAEARAAAEAKLAELQETLHQAKADSSVITDAPLLNEAELAQMREDFPTQARMYDVMAAEMVKLRQIALSQQVSQQTNEQAEVMRTVQDHIDANPKLSHLQASDPVAWNRAVDIDNQLKANPDFANLPMAERFVKATAVYESLYGAINVKPTATQEKPAAKTVDEVLAAAKPAAPRSLSDLPGGSPVESSELGNLENLTGAEISNNLMKMSPKQRDAYLNSLG